MNEKNMYDNVQIGGSKRIEGIHYTQDENTFTIFNVPIIAEMVQPYQDGFHYKPKDEILKVKVDNVPLTMVDDSPSHPEHLSELQTENKSKVIVGYMSEISKPRADMAPNKRYADFVIHKTPKTKIIIDTYLAEKYIDTSIGFRMDQVSQEGEFNGAKYSFIQTNIILDHNAILIDKNGNIGVGRMPSPIGGIGADKLEGEITMADKAMEVLEKQNDALAKDVESVKKLADETQKVADALKKELDDAKITISDRDKAIKELSDELKVFRDEKAAEIKAKRDELKTAYPDVADILEKADDELVVRKYDEFKKKESKEEKGRDLATDMHGPARAQNAGKSELERQKKIYGERKVNPNE